MFNPQQNPSQIVDIAGWIIDPVWEFVSQGIKPKHWIQSPESDIDDFIIPNHRYLFKYASTSSEAIQMYSEIIAYEFSRILEVNVPPAFLAIDSQRGRFGCIIEAFPPPNDQYDTRFIHAVELFQRDGYPINERIGSLRDNIRLSRSYRVPAALEWWRTTVSFDALIGNTDRHSENWGLLVHRQPFSDPFYQLAPTFDNGTSLGWRIGEVDLDSKSTDTAIAKFLRNGRHHYGWLSGDRSTSVHHVLCGHLKNLYGDPSGTMRRMIQLSDSDITEATEWAASFEAQYRFSVKRAQFVAKLTTAKRDALAKALED